MSLTPSAWIYIDTLSSAMMAVVSGIGVLVALFSKNYLQGDRRYGIFFIQMAVLIASVITISMANHLVLFLGAWCVCNITLSRMIAHKSTWSAAGFSGKMALMQLILGTCFLATAFFLVYNATGSLIIQDIIQKPLNSWPMGLATVAIILAAMTQSALCPFHRWLISSVNAPTPVSALMHAGVVNGGGFLLLRFAPLYAHNISLMNTIFVVGFFSTLVGSFWKVIQNDIKRMLACSTIAQMGFMFVQIGLGVFTSALAHICWHGLFKAYLFLSSGNAGKETRKDLGHYPFVPALFFSFFNGCLSTLVFAKISHHTQWDAGIVILGVVWISSTQLSLSMLSTHAIKRAPLALMVSTAFSALYGLNVHCFDRLCSPLWPMVQPLATQNVRPLHMVALCMLVLVWILVLFLKYDKKTRFFPHWALFLYVKMLNSSQPYPKTITDNRKGYDYV
jgi:NAD(P)H-quinone oxidoreductase subunit 5